ncbi:MAG: crosslink repair DNA glycosylase YcaQ family protein [Vicinamibacterales bacterium]
MSRAPAPLALSRGQILAFRRAAQGLDARQPAGPRSLRMAAWAGLQDSMPRAALLSIHARVRGTTPSTWEAPSLVQVWGPRYSAYVVDGRDAALFTLARLPESGATRRVAETLAGRLAAALAKGPMLHGDVARALGEPANRLRYATLTGRIRIRWDGARQPTLWAVPAPATDPRAARIELARRYLHVFGPSTAAGLAGWAGLPGPAAAAAFDELTRSRALIPVRTPMGDAWLLASDEPLMRRAAAAPAPARLLPSGDTYFLLHDAADRAFLVARAVDRARLWTSRVWPGALLVDGVIAGTWRRDHATVSIEPWRRLSPAERHAVEDEASSLPLPGVDGSVAVRWAPVA